MEKHKKQYQKYKNKLIHIIALAKKKHFTNQVEQSQHNSRILWKTVNDIIKLKKTKSSHYIKSSSFEEVSTPGQTHTGLGLRVYSFTTPDCCTA